MTSKVASIIGYIGILGWLIAFFGGKEQRDDFSVYHLKQGLGLAIVSFGFMILTQIVAAISPAIGSILSLVSLVFLVFMILGIINANNGVKKPLPLIGAMFEDKFDFIK
ncbi:MAG: DUF4870 domain-containing protein [Capnocytophaga sp.]|nr:DUF4870 domain-containing protein [Capnocytophaga sp.]